MTKIFLSWLFLLGITFGALAKEPGAARPNFLWIVAEDMSPDLGCYGDREARTPELDKFASQGARFTHAFTHAPVCAPSRSGLITGQYPTKIGSHHMRSQLLKPPPLFTDSLKKAGYFISWPGKTDFNFNVPPGSFDEVKQWFQVPKDRPFFAYVNLGESHEAQIRAPEAQFLKNTARLTPEQRHDPARSHLPAYYPHTPEALQDWARYNDLVTVVDYRVGDVLRKLEEMGVSENTVVFFFGDHGRGLPRAKRWVYDSGTRVPLIIRWPGNIPPGSVRNDLVSLIDFAPTVLSLAKVEIPKNFDGKPFLGPDAKTRDFVFSARDRMDETYDRIRSVRDGRFRYIRNYHPELPYAQPIQYMDEMPTMKSWRRAAAEKNLTGAPALFFAEKKPAEEFYDLAADPDEVVNVIKAKKYKKNLKTLRRALDKWQKETRDLGAIPEEVLIKRGLVADKLTEYKLQRTKN